LTDPTLPVQFPDDARMYIFDFCGVLYRCNTTKEFIRFLAADAGVAFRFRLYLYWISAKILKDMKIIDNDRYIEIRIRTLKGMSGDYLKKQGERFLAEALPAWQDDGMVNTMLRLKSEKRI
jgi:phosphoserine phosphatase